MLSFITREKLAFALVLAITLPVVFAIIRMEYRKADLLRRARERLRIDANDIGTRFSAWVNMPSSGKPSVTFWDLPLTPDQNVTVWFSEDGKSIEDVR